MEDRALAPLWNKLGAYLFRHGEQRPACPAVVAVLLEGLGEQALECVTVSELLVGRAPAAVAEEQPLSAA
jgi:hypothetical protein